MLGLAGAAGLYHRRQPQQDVIALVRRGVIRHGIRTLDTAPWYGCGKSEIDVGAAIDDIASSHPELVTPTSSDVDDAEHQSTVQIFTKVGRVTVQRRQDVSSPEAIAATAQRLNVPLDEFIKRVQVALVRDTCYFPHPETNDFVCIEVATARGVEDAWLASSERLGPRAAALVRSLRLHDADTDDLFREAAAEESGALAVLAQLGPNAIHGASLGLNVANVALRYLHHSPSGVFTSVMIAGSWNLLDQSALPLLLECQSQRADVHLAGVFASGYLWGGSCYRYAPVKEGDDLIRRRDQWSALAQTFGVTLPCVALQFALLPLCVTHAAVGCSTVQELDDTVALLHHFLPHTTFTKLLTCAAKEHLLSSDVVAALGLLSTYPSD
jgi:D-threo-aldose 1-dehydrogenase